MNVPFQINSKWLSKKVLEFVEKYSEMANSQYGCQKQNTLVADYFQICCSARIYITTDATGCFDRIVHSVMILILMIFGLVSTFDQTLFEVL